MADKKANTTQSHMHTHPKLLTHPYLTYGYNHGASEEDLILITNRHT